MATMEKEGLLTYIPGLLLCMILGWLALQWDESIHGWQKNLQECQKILKADADRKTPLPFDEYKLKGEKYKE